MTPPNTTTPNTPSGEGAPRGETRVGPRTYTLRDTGASSAKYGPCEVCGGRVSEVHLQTEYMDLDAYLAADDEPSQQSWFGHRECLLAQRRAL